MATGIGVVRWFIWSCTRIPAIVLSSVFVEAVICQLNVVVELKEKILSGPGLGVLGVGRCRCSN